MRLSCWNDAGIDTDKELSAKDNLVRLEAAGAVNEGSDPCNPIRWNVSMSAAGNDSKTHSGSCVLIETDWLVNTRTGLVAKSLVEQASLMGMDMARALTVVPRLRAGSLIVLLTWVIPMSCRAELMELKSSPEENTP